MVKKNTDIMSLFESDRAEEFRYEKVDDGIRIVAYAGTKNYVKIPEEIDGNTVVEFGEYSGGNISSIHPVILLPKTILRFNPDAFRMEASELWMDDIFISDDNPFFKIENGILYSADMKVLYFCFNKTISELKMPDTVEVVKKGAFRAVTNTYILDKITWSENLREIEDYAFHRLFHNGRGVINLPAGVKSLGLMAFNKSTEIVLNGEIESLTGCPAGKFNINNDFYITENKFLYSADKKKAIGYCMKTASYSDEISSEKAIAFDKQTEEILPYAFYNFSRLEKLDLGSSVKSIGSHAFQKARIKTIRIPAQVEEIACDAFGYDRCSSIIVDKANTHFMSDKVCLYKLNEDGTKTLMKCFKYTIEEYAVLDGTSSIYAEAFLNCSSLRTLILPDSLTEFDGNCIRYTSINSIIIPKSVRTLVNLSNKNYSVSDDNPYFIYEDKILYKRGADGLIAIDASHEAENVVIKEGTVEIANYAFLNHSNIATVTLPDLLIRIGHDAFSHCGIKQITFNSGLKVIDDCAFENCKLKEVNLPDSVEYVCRTAFNGCPVTEYKANNRFYCSEDGVLYSADKTIMYAFPKNKKIDEFEVPEGVKHIGQALRNSTFKKLTLPNSVTTLCEQSLECGATDISTGKNLCSVNKHCLSLYSWTLKAKSYSFHGYPDSVLLDFVTYVKEKITEVTADVELFGTESYSSLSDEFDVVPCENGVVITKHKTDNPDVVIPACIGDYPVVEVSDAAFINQEVRSLTVESAQTRINYTKFYTVEELVLPDGMKEIPDNAFEFKRIKSVTIPRSVEKIGEKAFNNCDRLESLVIPGSVKTLSEKMLTYCERLKVVVIEEGVEEICSGVFFACASLKKVVLPASINSISANLFSNGDNYKDLYLNPKTIYITVPGSYADTFLRSYEAGQWNKFNLKVINSTESESIESLEVFNSFLYVPSGTNTVRVLMKSHAEAEETDVVIPEKIGDKTVNEIVFDGNLTGFRPTIKTLTIPSSVEKISGITEKLFNMVYEWTTVQCTNIIVAENNPYYWSDGKALYSKDKTKLIHIFAYDLTEYEIPDGVSEVCDAAFSHQKNITRVVLPDSVERIGERAFYSCKNLAEIVGADKVKNVAVNAYNSTPYIQNIPVVILGDIYKSCTIVDQTVIKIPEGIREIASNAFSGQNSIVEKIELPTTLRKIGRNAFDQLRKLTELTIPNGVEEIVDYLFAGLDSVKTIDLPASVTMIGNGVFPGMSYFKANLESINVDSDNSTYSSQDGILYSKDMTKLIKVPCAYPASKVILPDTVKTICAGAFAFNRTVEEVVLPIATNEICEGAFESCEALEKINLSGIKVMGEDAFNRCEKLKEVKLSCKTIPPKAFRGCYKLESVDIINTEEIGEQAFSGCEKIVSIEFPESLKKIGVSAFNGCTFKSVTIPKTIQEVGRCAFGGVKHISVFDNLQAEIGYLCISRIDYKDYVRYHLITVLSSETGEEKFSVPMDSDGSADYCSLLTRSWGEGATFNFKAIDGYFSKLKGADVKIRTCINRLKNPIDLSDSAKETYIAYAVKNAKTIMMRFIDSNDIESFSKFENFGTIKKANVDDLIEYAVKNQAIEFSAFLMDYKEKNFSSKKSTKSELSLGSVRSVAPWQISKNALSMVGRYKGNEISVEFPAELDGKVITGIANSSISVPDNYKNLVSVIIPEGYISVGDNAFLGCENLENVVLPSSLEKIGKSAFENCKKLKEIIIPDTVKEIGTKCFRGCASLEKVKLPMATETLEKSTFEGCGALKTIDIPRSIRFITECCFSSSGIETATVHNRKPQIVESAFDKGVSFIAYKGALSSKAVKEITLADVPSDTMINISGEDSKGNAFVYGLFIKECERTITQFSKKELISSFGSIADGVSLASWLEGVYGKLIRSNSGNQEDFEKISAIVSISKILVKEEKHNVDGTTTAVFSFDLGTCTGELKREGTFAAEKRMTGYYKYYYVKDKEEYSLPTNDDGSMYSFTPIESIDFKGKLFVLTGFNESDEIAITRIIEEKGGEIKSSVVLKTDYLIVNEDYDHVTTKYKKAVELNERGKNIAIISASVFNELSR